MVTVLEFTWAPTPEKIKQTTPGYKIIEKLPSPRVIITHIPEPLCPPQWFTKRAKIIYFARNPKDVMVSSYNFMKPILNPKLRSWEAFFKYFCGDYGKEILTLNIWILNLETYVHYNEKLLLIFLFISNTFVICNVR
ncbi:Bile salt sulfotransferase [Holothuria leucospilota]|uniref:Bile salt sulfotransferase n=1 Tax=Holothuria leucospilota TaxID=206669 RepID=A0A9Q1C8Z8_HOLLE|nr:Bile salt sulfotransferase [Holothuria leucospilota]